MFLSAGLAFRAFWGIGSFLNLLQFDVFGVPLCKWPGPALLESLGLRVVLPAMACRVYLLLFGVSSRIA